MGLKIGKLVIEALPDVWVIWILPTDPEYNDGVRTLFLYISGKIGGTKELQDLLKYMHVADMEYRKQMLEEAKCKK